MQWPVIEQGLAAWQERILTLNWYQCPIKKLTLCLNRGIVLQEKEKKENTKTSKQTKKSKVEKGIQIIQE